MFDFKLFHHLLAIFAEFTIKHFYGVGYVYLLHGQAGECYKEEKKRFTR